MISNLKYQPHIDGFRALAVVPVILFHDGINMTLALFVPQLPDILNI